MFDGGDKPRIADRRRGVRRNGSGPESRKPDLILLDIGLPALHGIQAARHIRTLSPESKIIFVSQESSSDVVREAIGLGARGYVVKTRAASDLLAAVQAVYEGKLFVSGGIM